MKHTWKLLAVMALMPVAVMAQTNLDSEVNAELEKMYKDQATQTQAPAQAATAQATAVAAPAAAAPAPAPMMQPTVVQTQTVVSPATALVSASPAAIAGSAAESKAAVKQPTTVIEASPLTESGAERLRKARQEAEVSTEQNIVQKLEQSRLEDEKKRADVLFGDKFSQLNNKQNEQAAPVAAAVVAPVAVQQVVATAPVVAEVKQEKGMDRDQVRGEVSAALADLKAQEEKPKGQNYVGILGGAGVYPDAKNVRSQYAAGVAVGRKFDDRFAVEGTFMYSNYQVDQTMTSGCGAIDYMGNCYPRITNMNQYAGQALIKYQLLGGTFRPEIGALAAYTYRTYSDTQFSMSNAQATSNALDAGLMAGASLELTEKFSVGLDFRYLWNLSYKTSGLQTSFQQTFMNSTSPVETLNYYTVNVVGRLSF